jgi:nucleoside-diphosphate-sugar epimerase
MRILITGGAGCLGAALIEHLLPAGHELLIIDNFATGKRGNLPDDAGVKLIDGSIADQELVDRAFDSFAPTCVIHSAASYKNPNDWLEDGRTNVIGTIHVANAARRTGVKRVLNFQTALCYGRTEQVPIPANHPLRPFTSYGVSKVAGEQILLAAGLSCTSLRIANVTGPRLVIGPIPTFYKRLKTGQKCFCSAAVRDFIDMGDFLTLIDYTLTEGAPSGVFNVSSGEGHSIKEVFDIVVNYLGVKLGEPVPIVPVSADDVPTVVLDYSETERFLGWRPKVSFEQAVAQTLAWYDQHGVTDVYSHLKAPVAS